MGATQVRVNKFVLMYMYHSLLLRGPGLIRRLASFHDNIFMFVICNLFPLMNLCSCVFLSTGFSYFCQVLFLFAYIVSCFYASLYLLVGALPQL